MPRTSAATSSCPARLSSRSPDQPSVEDDHRAGHLASRHGRKAVVDLVELDPGRHELVQLEPAIEVQVDVAGHVLTEAVGAHGRPLNLLLVEEVDAGQLEVGPWGDHADDRRRPTLLQHAERLLGGDLQADGLERVVDTAAGPAEPGSPGEQ